MTIADPKGSEIRTSLLSAIALLAMLEWLYPDSGWTLAHFCRISCLYPRQVFMVHLILYSKPGCHLCEGLQAKLEQIQAFAIALEIRDITTRQDWFQTYEYEIPVLYLVHSPAERQQG